MGGAPSCGLAADHSSGTPVFLVYAIDYHAPDSEYVQRPQWMPSLSRQVGPLVDERATGSLHGARSDDIAAFSELAVLHPVDVVAEVVQPGRYLGLGEKDRVLAVCDALNGGDYERVGELMYQTHEGLSKDYEVSCEELDYLNEIARKNGVTGSRIMGGGFGGCTINLVRNDLYRQFVDDAIKCFDEKYGHKPKVYDVVIGDGSRKLC